MLGGTGRSFEKGVGLRACSFARLRECQFVRAPSRLVCSRGAGWSCWFAIVLGGAGLFGGVSLLRAVELLGASLRRLSGHRSGFVPRMFRLAFAVFLVSSVAPLGRRAFRLANAPKASVAFSPHLEIAASMYE